MEVIDDVYVFGRSRFLTLIWHEEVEAQQRPAIHLMNE